MASYEELQKLGAWLKRSEVSVGKTVLMPMTDLKAPKHKHLGKAKWGWAEADAYANNNPTHKAWGMLLDGLVVIDADDAETVQWLERMEDEDGEVGEAMQRCAIQETRKGRHYMFLRPTWADEEGYYDGARQVDDDARKVDMKSLCRTGTRGLLSVAPTEGKAWKEGRAPWELESIPYIPKALMERVAVAKKKNKRTSKGAEGYSKAKVDNTSTTTKEVEQGIMMPTSFMESTHVEKILLLLGKNRWDSRDTWRGVATALKNEYGEAYKALWKNMSKVSPRYDEDDAEKLWETVGRPDYDGPKLTMKSVVKWACEDDPRGYAVYRASSIPKIIRDSWDKGDRGLGEIVHFLLQETVKKTGHSDYYIFDEDTCRWAKVDDGWVKNVASKVLEGVLRDVDLWISTQAAQMLCIGVGKEGEGEDSRSKADLDAKKKKVATLINYVMSYRGVTNAMAFAGPLLMDETFEQRLDGNRHLIGIKGGGVVDLRTGQKRQRVAEDMVHNELDVEYDNNDDDNDKKHERTNAARAEWMHRIVEKIMGGDEAMASFLQRLLGYGITGEVREEIFPIWTGSGRNGKGLLTQALQQLLGAYYKEMNCAIISDSRVCSNIDAERAKLIGARLAVFNELKDGEKLKTNEVQLLTGGDGFPAKALYKDPVTVQPRHLAILVTNYMPEMSDAIVAMVERLMVVEFPVTFRDLIPGENETVTLRQSDKTMKERLKSPEGQSALFAWLVEGAVAWYSGTESLKAGAPKKVTEFTRQYLADQDGVQAFLAENCEFGEDFRVSGVALFNMYREVSSENKDREKWFYGQIKRKGFVKKVMRIEGDLTRGYMGLRLR
jgi:putative DNA primase/helicase